MSACEWDGPDLFLQVKVQPRASRDEWSELQENRQRIRITATPTDGKANAHLCKFLASEFGVAKSSVTLVSGHNNREKRLRIVAPKRWPKGLVRPE